MKCQHRLIPFAAACLALAQIASVNAQIFTNHVYEWVSGGFTWHEAKADAESRGGHLATITSHEEVDWILGLNVIPPEHGDYWIGGTSEGHVGTWIWITGEPWDFTLWREGEPNNATGTEFYLSGKGTASEYPHNWNDASATSLLPYLLERSLCIPAVPRPATATATVINGFVVGATLTSGGCGYSEPPLVIIRGSGTGATATTTIGDAMVTEIHIMNAGFGYDEDTIILIASPPFMPSLEIAVSRVMVTLHVVLGRKYVLESSADLTTWSQVGDPFTAEAELIQQEFDVAETGRYFRIEQIP